MKVVSKSLTHSGGQKPGALFSWLIRNRKFEFITQADEDAAVRRIKAHLLPDQPRSSAEDDAQEPPTEIPEDRVIRTCIRVGRQYKVRPFTIAQKSKGWTRDEWVRALESYELRFGPVG